MAIGTDPNLTVEVGDNVMFSAFGGGTPIKLKDGEDYIIVQEAHIEAIVDM